MRSNVRYNEFGQLYERLDSKSKVKALIGRWIDSEFRTLDTRDCDYLNEASAWERNCVDGRGDVYRQYQEETPETRMVSEFLEVYSRRHAMQAKRRPCLSTCSQCTQPFAVKLIGAAAEFCSEGCREARRAQVAADKKKATKKKAAKR